VTIAAEMTSQRLHNLLSAIRMWWPEAYLHETRHTGRLTPPLQIPCEVHVHKNAFVKDLADRDGVVAEVDPLFFTMIIQPKSVTFVVGPEGSEGDLIVQDLRALLV